MARASLGDLNPPSVPLGVDRGRLVADADLRVTGPLVVMSLQESWLVKAGESFYFDARLVDGAVRWERSKAK